MVVRNITLATAFFNQLEEQEDTQEIQTTFKLINATIQNLKQSKYNPSDPPLNMGHFFHVQGPTNYIIDNVVINNSIFYSKRKVEILIIINFVARNLINFLPSHKQFLNVFSLLPFTSISNVTILNSKHLNIVAPYMDRVQIQNVFIQNNSLNSKKITHPLISVSISHACDINNVTVKDNVGPVIKLQYVLSHRITNCFFENVTNSQQLSEKNQFQIRIDQQNPYPGLNGTKEKTIVIQNVSLNVMKKYFWFSDSDRDYKILILYWILLTPLVLL